MTVTNTVYPPAGATALLAAVDPQVEGLEWSLLPLVLLSSTLTLMTSLVINNIQRRYPTFWWTPGNVGKVSKNNDIEKAPKKSTRISDCSSSLDCAAIDVVSPHQNLIKIAADHIVVPDGFYLAEEERSVLEILQDRFRDGLARPTESLAQV